MHGKLGFLGYLSYIYHVLIIKIKVMFKLNGVIGYLKNKLNYTYPQVLEFINSIPGECQGDDVMLKGSDIEKLLGVAEHRKLECEVVQHINL